MNKIQSCNPFITFTFSLSIGFSLYDKLEESRGDFDDGDDDNADNAVLSAFNAKTDCAENYPCLGFN